MKKKRSVPADSLLPPIIIGKPIAQLAVAFSTLAGPQTKALIVADAAVAKNYGRSLLKSLGHAGVAAQIVSIPSGERSKSLAQAEKLYRLCAHSQLERQSWLIALGGGVVGDLTGFVAATYLRGIPFVQVPTTLLAQVDASIGGKTAVDIPQGKNLVGAFYQPRLIWIDPSLLRSLPDVHWRNGMAEVIKYGAIQDIDLFAALEEQIVALMEGYSSRWVDIIRRCANIKARVVERDPRETSGLRATLNFGHSIGHALEAATGYRKYLHGEAISIGMFVASFISEQMGLMPTVDRIRLGTLLTKAGLPLRVAQSVPRARIMEYLARDKKVEEGSVRFVLLAGLGKARVGQRVAPELLDLALSASGL